MSEQSREDSVLYGRGLSIGTALSEKIEKLCVAMCGIIVRLCVRICENVHAYASVGVCGGVIGAVLKRGNVSCYLRFLP